MRPAEPWPDPLQQPYVLPTELNSRSISFENPTGEPGVGGKAASKLGPGRKGAPARDIKPGETVDLCNIFGPGTIRHIWLTTERDPAVQRACVIRAYWEGQSHPSIECPIGDLCITIQQIAWKDGLFETQDDWSCSTFWYEPVPSAELPPMPEVKARTADIWSE
jgi:hypothetical protein